LAKNDLGKREIAALLALAKGETTDEAGLAAGVSGRTVRRWLEDGRFRGEVARLRGALLDQTTGRLADAAIGAVATLTESLAADSEAVRVRAARAILAATLRYKEVLDLEQRVSKLEAAYAETDGLR
jgi:hypothetical protein